VRPRRILTITKHENGRATITLMGCDHKIDSPVLMVPVYESANREDREVSCTECRWIARVEPKE
jgi:hypothetical protein